jgi:2,4-dienoyl-CoA reductase-like NADH-dependent reductase (Old Yellow Enzyme family)/thioredoxin reductase
MLTHLFQPIRIGNLQLKNRIKLSPLALGYAEAEQVTTRIIEFYRARAQGGTGFIGVAVYPTKLINPPMPGIYDDRFIPGLRTVAEACHIDEVKVYTQMGANYAWCFDGHTVEVVSPSGISVTGKPETPFIGGGPPRGSYTTRRALTADEVRMIVQAYGKGARRAREAGFDAVDFVVNSYLLGQFLSPLTNFRADEYGGSFENRMRFLLETIKAAKDEAGHDFTITCRLARQCAGNAIPVEDLQKVAALLEKAGVAAIDILPGWHEDPLPLVHPSVPAGQWAELAAHVKKGAKIPIGAGTRMSTPEVAEAVLAQGKADYIYMARPIIADPDLPMKAMQGKLAEIRPCIACNVCFETIEQPGGLTCAVNPRAGKEGELTLGPAAKKKNVLVVGGGPAGLTAATIAANRGHNVVLYEKGGELGGQLIPASRPPFKLEIEKLRLYLIDQAKRAGVRMKIGTVLDVATVNQESPGAIILASGARPSIPPLPGVGLENVVTAVDVLLGKKKTGETVVVVGGGLIGCETAEFLAAMGKKVTIVEMLKRVAADVNPFNRWTLVQRLNALGVRIEVRAEVKEFLDNGVRIARDGQEEVLAGQSIVLAVGMMPFIDNTETFSVRAAQVLRIGDCVQPRRLRDAIHEGFKVGMEV